jgi:cholesterol oxidase
MAEDYGWSIDYAMRAPGALPPIEVAAEPHPASPAAAHQGLLDRLKERLTDWAHEVEHEVLDEIHHVFGSVANALEQGAIDLAKSLLRGIIEKYPELLSPSFQFTETMDGFVSANEAGRESDPRKRISTDFELATAWGRAKKQPMKFELTIHTDKLHRLTSDPAHPASISGNVTCAALNPQPMRVLRGDFHLLPADPDHVETWNMTYDMVLERTGGNVLFHGFKVLHQHTDSHWWDDVTTLFVTVCEGEDGKGRLLAQGTLRLDLEDLMWQGNSVKIGCAHGMLADLVNHIPAAASAINMIYMGRFAGFFGGVLFQSYGGMLADMKNFPLAARAQVKPLQRPPARPLAAPQPVVHPVALTDGFKIKLTRYQGGGKGPVILAPGFTVKASSFAIDTVRENLVEFLTKHGYDVWLFDYRASPDSGNPIKAFTIDDIVEVDWKECISYVCGQTRAADVQVIAHCVGSMSLLMALLKGQTGVRSVISSALTLHPVTNWLSYIKVDLGLVRLMEQLDDFKGGFNVVPIALDEVAEKVKFDHQIDAVAWNVPVPEGEQCKNPVCHRVFSIFGPSYAHAQLNQATHDAMMDMFGEVAIPPFEQLALIMEREQAVDRFGKNIYLQRANAAKLALPITFITGRLNQIFDPETVARTYRWVVEHNGPANEERHLYEQHLFEGYAHMDMFIGRNAAADVYPYLLERLEPYAMPRG